jgi:hypothetical protein
MWVLAQIPFTQHPVAHSGPDAEQLKPMPLPQVNSSLSKHLPN